jgi:hypothetical protein
MAGIPRISMHYQCDFATGASGSLNAQFPLPTSPPAAETNDRCRDSSSGDNGEKEKEKE